MSYDADFTRIPDFTREYANAKIFYYTKGNNFYMLQRYSSRNSCVLCARQSRNERNNLKKNCICLKSIFLIQITTQHLVSIVIYKRNCFNCFVGKHNSSENRTLRTPLKYEVK